MGDEHHGQRSSIHRRSSRSCRLSRDSASSALKGSSISSTSGAPSARAQLRPAAASRQTTARDSSAWRLEPDQAQRLHAILRLARLPRLHSVRAAGAELEVTEHRQPGEERLGVLLENVTMPGGGSATRSPLNHTAPRVGGMRPASMRRIVDLPQPEGPRLTNRPRAASKLTLDRGKSAENLG